jgi:sulfhydrogenase subunit delta
MSVILGGTTPPDPPVRGDPSLRTPLGGDPSPRAPLARPKLAVWKLASCDGCQLTLLDCEDELLAVAGAVQIAHFTEASSEHVEGPYDVSLVEGSVTTERDARRIVEIRRASRVLVCIGACATAGGIQALRNFADVAEFTSVVYARPDYISALATSTPVADHVQVDFELRGCPIDRRQLLELLTALLAGRKPQIPAHSVCYDCKLRGTSCVMVAHGTPCLGPVTQAGCGAICPAFGRGCYGCFGPVTAPNVTALTAQLRHLGMTEAEVDRVFATFNAASPALVSARGTGTTVRSHVLYRVLGPVLRQRRGVHGFLHRPDRRDQRVEPVQVTAQLGQVPGPRSGGHILGRAGEPVQSYPQKHPGLHAAAALCGDGTHASARGLRLGDDRGRRLRDLGHDLEGQRPCLAASRHPQPQQVRLAPRLMILCRVGGSHGL